MDRKSLQANIMLLSAAVIWGGGFVAQRIGMNQMGPYLFNGFRFLLGAAAMIPIMALNKGSIGVGGGNWKRTWIVGCGAGLILMGGATFQQLGLVYTTAGKAGFITGLYVILVPMLGMLWGDRPPLTTWVGAVLAVVGLYLLSTRGGLSLAPGDAYVLIGAFFWAGHVQFMARFAPEMDPFQLSFVQSLVTCLISLGIGFWVEPLVWQQVGAAVWPILYGGLISIGLAYTFQIIAQQSARPTSAAIILSLESVFAALWGWLILGEILSLRAGVGSALMLGGMVVSQIAWGQKPSVRRLISLPSPTASRYKDSRRSRSDSD